MNLPKTRAAVEKLEAESRLTPDQWVKLDNAMCKALVQAAGTLFIAASRDRPPKRSTGWRAAGLAR